jgi:hypothetical protein
VPLTSIHQALEDPAQHVRRDSVDLVSFAYAKSESFENVVEGIAPQGIGECGHAVPALDRMRLEEPTIEIGNCTDREPFRPSLGRLIEGAEEQWLERTAMK